MKNVLRRGATCLEQTDLPLETLFDLPKLVIESQTGGRPPEARLTSRSEAILLSPPAHSYVARLAFLTERKPGRVLW